MFSPDYIEKTTQCGNYRLLVLQRLLPYDQVNIITWFVNSQTSSVSDVTIMQPVTSLPSMILSETTLRPCLNAVCIIIRCSRHLAVELLIDALFLFMGNTISEHFKIRYNKKETLGTLSDLLDITVVLMYDV